MPGMDEEEIPVYLEYLKKNKRLSVTENGIVLKLPSLIDFITNIQDERQRVVLKERLSGKTYKEIAKLLSISKERAKQVEKKGLNIVKALNMKMNGTYLFEEDRFVYLYENYLFNKNDLMKYFELSENQYNAIRLLSGKKGTKIADDDALQDDRLDKEMKARIRRFIDKDLIKVDGRKIPIRKQSIRDYILETKCINEATVKSFAEANNSFVKAHQLEGRSDLLIGEKQMKYLENLIFGSIDVLHKKGGRFRYYDIASRDYSELLEELHLESYENILISTEKLMKGNEHIMKKYDIRDEYELHDLLKKIYNTQDLFRQYERYFCEKAESRITFSRVPGLLFGLFDRDARVRELLKKLSPISKKDFISVLSEKSGFSEDVISVDWLDCVRPYKRIVNGHGEYNVESEPVSPENAGKHTRSKL